jgi:tetratricopeptide (TPR) repeat protein
MMKSPAIAALLICLASPGVAAVEDDTKTCTDVNAADAARIAACTRVIDSGKYTGAGLAWAYSTRGSVHMAKGDNTRAIKDFDEAIKLDPNAGDAYYNRGIVYTDKNDLTRAVHDFDAAIKINPNDAGALASRCYARALIGKALEGALDDCTKSLGLEANGYTNDSRGLVYLKLKRFDEALADYDAAVNGDPESASALYGRGVAKLRTGDKAGGNKDIAAAKKLDSRIAATYAKRGVTP